MGSSDRGKETKSTNEDFSEILLRISNNEEHAPVVYQPNGYHFKNMFEKGYYFTRAVEELEKEITSAKEGKREIKISLEAFNIYGNGIFHLLELSKNKIIGPEIAEDPRVDAALEIWSRNSGIAFQAIQYLDNIARDQYFRNLLTEKNKIPPNIIAVKISEKLLQALKKERSFFLPTAHFLVKESLAAFNRIDKECKKFAKQESTLRARVEKIHHPQSEAVVLISDKLKQLNEVILNPANDPENNKLLQSRVEQLDKAQAKKLKKFMKDFIPTAKKIHQEMEVFVLSQMTGNRVNEIENFEVLQTMISAMQKFIQNPADKDSLFIMIQTKQELEKIYTKQPQIKMNKHNYTRSYLGIFIGMGVMLLAAALFTGPAAIPLIVVGGLILAAAVYEPIGLFTHHNKIARNRVGQMQKHLDQASALLVDLKVDNALSLPAAPIDESAKTPPPADQKSLYPAIEITEQDILGMALGKLDNRVSSYDKQLCELYFKISDLIFKIKNNTLNDSVESVAEFSYATTHAAYKFVNEKLFEKVGGFNSIEERNGFLTKLQETFLNHVVMVQKGSVSIPIAYPAAPSKSDTKKSHLLFSRKSANDSRQSENNEAVRKSKKT